LILYLQIFMKSLLTFPILNWLSLLLTILLCSLTSIY
jgi:hypothetical protein